MQIATNTVVTIDYTLRDDNGEVIDTSEWHDSLAYLHGARNIVPGLEKALEGKSKGDSLSVSVAPEEGYGARDDDKVQAVPRAMFPDDGSVNVGERYVASGPNGEQVPVTVVQVDAEHVVVDGNHPLAGQNLNFDVTVVDVRVATQEELEHGHVHGPGGHHHG